VVSLAPRAPGDSVLPRRLSGVVVRPLNFTVRLLLAERHRHFQRNRNSTRKRPGRRSRHDGTNSRTVTADES
jgi:hypothetical protein